jgi:hypothetical protein
MHPALLSERLRLAACCCCCAAGEECPRLLLGRPGLQGLSLEVCCANSDCRHSSFSIMLASSACFWPCRQRFSWGDMSWLQGRLVAAVLESSG